MYENYKEQRMNQMLQPVLIKLPPVANVLAFVATTISDRENDEPLLFGKGFEHNSESDEH